MDHQGRKEAVPSEQSFINGRPGALSDLPSVPTSDAFVLIPQESSPRIDRPSSSKGYEPPGVPQLDLASPQAFSSPLFYETTRDTQAPNSCPTPSSTGAARGANPSDISKRRDGSKSPVISMSSLNDEQDQESGVPSTSASFCSTHGSSFQRPIEQHSFPSQTYYPAHSVPHQERAYPPPASYPPQRGPGPSFMGQYMASQQSMSIPPQSHAQFGYSHSFTHAGIHAQETNPLGMQFGQHHPQQNRGYAYPHPPGLPGPVSEAHVGDRAMRPVQSYTGPSSPFAEASAGSQQTPAPSASSPHMSHHAYSPMHYSPSSASPHYTGYSSHSFPHSSQGMYPFGPPPAPYPQSLYGRQPASAEDPSNTGGWWFIPPGSARQYSSSAYSSGYPPPGYHSPMQIGRPGFEPYPSHARSGPRSSTPPPFSGTSNQPLRSPPGTVATRGRPLLPSSPAPTRAASDALRPTSPLSKKKAVSASPPAASRKAYHPNPPPNRSEWVMWVGNVPSDATHDELWRFFNQAAPVHVPPLGTSAVRPSPQARLDEEDDVWGGVASVFLISRSNCAFVNFETEQHLLSAVAHFNGKPIRPRDPRCPRLVCRVRRKDDDLKAGVGGQRGMGLHTRWAKERELERVQQAEKENEPGEKRENVERGEDIESSGEGPPTSPSTYLASDPSPPIPAVSPTDDPGAVPFSGSQRLSGDHEPKQSSSGNQSFTSTNSSFLAANFPKRYFILKSLTQYDLNLSLERGIWATQPHNEEILDQAYRTSTDVFLIFGANKSGEFFGYARMAGPIFHNERVDHVSWASRSSGHGSVSGARAGPEVIEEEDESDRNFLSPSEHRVVAESPAPVTSGEGAHVKQISIAGPTVGPHTAPAELNQPHKPISHLQTETLSEGHQKPTTGGPARATSEGFPFGTSSKIMNLRTLQTPHDSASKRSVPFASAIDAAALRKDTLESPEKQRLHEASSVVNVAAIAAAAASDGQLPVSPGVGLKTERGDPPTEDKPEGWGREFKIEWLRTERLPFHRTRHLRNPWNNDREVKVSRDGTELEPNAGQQLLDEWDKPSAEVEASPPTSPASRGRGPRAPMRAAAAAASMPSVSSQHRTGSSSAIGQGRGRATT